MENLMMFHCSNKNKKRIVTALFIFGICLVLAFSVIAPPIAYANEINQTISAFSVVASTVAGTMTSYAICAAAGITTVAAATASIYAFGIILLSIGVGITVAWFVNLLLSEESLDMFGVDFWKIISKCYDGITNSISIAAEDFNFVVMKIKAFFGIAPTTSYSSMPYQEYDTFDGMNYKSEFGLVGSSDSYHYDFDKYILQDIQNSDVNDISEVSIDDDLTMSLKKTDGYFNVSWLGNDLRFNIIYDTGLSFSYGVTKPILIGDELYFCSSKTWGFNSVHNFYKNNLPTFNGKGLSFRNYVTDSSGQYYYCCKSDGSFVFPTSLANFFYLVFIKDYTIITSAEKINVVDVSELADEDTSVLGNLSGTISSGINATVIGKYAKQSTYDKDKDIVSGLAGAIGSSATGDVTITAAEVPNVKVDENTDVSSAVTITDVTANDVVNSETGTEVMLDAQTAWVTGLNTLKIASAGISDKFPFCLPSYLSEQLNILVGEEKKPIFVIPFRIQSANINESITIDLTKFDKLLTVTDFFLVAILVVGLAFSTKKLLF